MGWAELRVLRQVLPALLASQLSSPSALGQAFGLQGLRQQHVAFHNLCSTQTRRICSLSRHLLELMSDADVEVVSITLSVFTNVLQQDNILISRVTASKLAESLLPHLGHVRLGAPSHGH